MSDQPSGPAPSAEIIAGSGLGFADVLDATNDCIFVHDHTGTIVYVNRASTLMYGYARDEFRGLGPEALSEGTPPFSAAEADINVEKAIRDGSHVFTWRARKKSGELFWTEVSLRSAEAAGRTWIIAVVRNIDAEHRAEVALRESEDRLARVFNSSSNGLAITDLSTGHIIDVNRTWEELSGLPREAVVGRTAAELGLWFRSEDRDVCRAALLTSGRIRDFETALATPSGSRVYLLSAEAFELGDGRAVLWEFKDIEERRQLESQLLQAQKLESVGRLAGGVAHDFNNMLGVILGHVELLMHDFHPQDARRESLVAVRQAARRSAELTRQLLAFARQQMVTPKVLSLNDAVESMLKMLRRLMGEDIELVWTPGLNVWPVMIDPVQVDQILANLCVNARDAIRGIGQVAIDTAQVSIDAATAATYSASAGDYVRLSIRDTGTGITPDIQSKIFEPFFTTKPLGQGTGLGLSTVHGIVLQNRGFIAMESVIDRGTTFHIHIPRCDGSVAANADELVVPVPRGFGERVLLVEDEPAMLEMMTAMLEMRGFTVIPATTPRQALDLSADPALVIDAVVSDVIMPQMNGRQLLDALRRQRPNLGCLFVSGYTADALAEHGITPDAERFLAKPFSTIDFMTTLRNVIDQP